MSSSSDNLIRRKRCAQEFNQWLRLLERAGDEVGKFLANHKFVVVQLHESQEVLELQIFDSWVIFRKSFGSRLQFLPMNLAKALLKTPRSKNLQKLVPVVSNRCPKLQQLARFRIVFSSRQKAVPGLEVEIIAWHR